MMGASSAIGLNTDIRQLYLLTEVKVRTMLITLSNPSPPIVHKHHAEFNSGISKGVTASS